MVIKFKIIGEKYRAQIRIVDHTDSIEKIKEGVYLKFVQVGILSHQSDKHTPFWKGISIYEGESLDVACAKLSHFIPSFDIPSNCYKYLDENWNQLVSKLRKEKH